MFKKVVAEEDDFGHEMRVGGLLRQNAAIQYEHGGTYTDEVSAKARQFDFRCSIARKSERLALGVECKNLNRAAPLVVSGTNRRSEEAFHDVVESRTGRFESGSLITVGLSSITRRSCDTFYRTGDFVGKSLLRIKTAKNVPAGAPDGDVYDRWAQALASGVELVRDACPLSKTLKRASVRTAVLPVVVTPNDTLWTVAYDDRGEATADAAPVQACELFVSGTLTLGQRPTAHRFVFSHVHFFTLAGFESFLLEISRGGGGWGKLFDSEATERK